MMLFHFYPKKSGPPFATLQASFPVILYTVASSIITTLFSYLLIQIDTSDICLYNILFKVLLNTLIYSCG